MKKAERKRSRKIHSLMLASLCLFLAFLPVQSVRAASGSIKTDQSLNAFATENTVFDDEWIETEEDLFIEDDAPGGMTSAALAQGFIRERMPAKRRTLRIARPQGIRLTGSNRQLYEKMRTDVTRVANGEETSTIFQYFMDDIFEQLSFTAEELGVENITADGKATDETKQAVTRLLNNQYQTRAVLMALLADCPYELYWFDKTKALSHVKSYRFEFPDPDTIVVANGKFTIRMPVSVDYAPEEAEPDDAGRIYEMDPQYGLSVVAAAVNAQAVYLAYEGMENYERLWNYKNEIKNLSGYNHAAAGNSGIPYGNPWQMIWVFDGDPDTTVVCEGFSKAFQYLNDLSSGSAEVITVQGQMVGVGKHMWNIVTMEDGHNYLADLTNCSKGAIYSNENLFLTGYQSGDALEGYECILGNRTYRYIYNSDMGFTDEVLLLFPFSYLESGELIPQADYSAEIGIPGYDLVGRLKGPMASRAATVNVLRTAVAEPEEENPEGEDEGEGGESGEESEIIEETLECRNGFFRIPIEAEGEWHYSLSVSLEDGWTSEFGAETTIQVIPMEESIRIPEAVELIEDEAFRGVPIRMIRIPESVYEIGAYAFAELWHIRP